MATMKTNTPKNNHFRLLAKLASDHLDGLNDDQTLTDEQRGRLEEISNVIEASRVTAFYGLRSIGALLALAADSESGPAKNEDLAGIGFLIEGLTEMMDGLYQTELMIDARSN